MKEEPSGCPPLPAVHNDGCVQGSLVQVMRVYLLDKAQQVTWAVRQASVEQGTVMEEPGLIQGPCPSQNQGVGCLPPPQPCDHPRTIQAKWGSGGAQVNA